MSNIEAVTKVADQIVSRLFDHRHFTTGEINHLAREFGEQVLLDENFDKLLKINENVCLISDTSSRGEGMCSAYDDKRKSICDQVGSLLDRTESILRLESEFREKDERLQVETRRELERRKQECMRDCDTKLEQLRESIVEEELELERKYLKFEENLRNK